MPALDPFISRQDLSDFLGIDVTEDEGAVIAVDAACDMVRTVAGQSFNEVTDDEITLDGSGTEALVLPQFPTSSVKTVEVSGEAVTDYVLDAGNGLLIRKVNTEEESEESEESASWSLYKWPLGRQNITVTYTHGYPAEEIPRDVRMVALMVASRLIAQGLAETETIGEVSVRYATKPTELSSGEKLILDKYRRTR